MTNVLLKLANILFMTLLAVVFLAFMIYSLFQADAIGPWQESFPELLIFLGTMYLSGALAVFGHDLGHCIGAWAMGFHITEFAVGSVKWSRDGGSFRMRRNRTPGALGYVLAFPRDTRRLRLRFAAVVVGGPLASGLIAAAAFGGASVIHDATPHSMIRLPPNSPGRRLGDGFLMSPRSSAVGVLNIFAAANIGLALITLFPARLGFETDGFQLLTLIGRARGERLAALWSVTSQLISGVRLRELSPALVDELARVRDGTFVDANANLYLAYIRYDLADMVGTNEYLDLAVKQAEQCSPTLAAVVFSEAAFFAARVRRDAVSADAFLKRADKLGRGSSLTWLRASAAVRLCEGNTAEALSLANKALVELPRSLDRGGAISEKEWLDAIVAEANVARRSAS